MRRVPQIVAVLTLMGLTCLGAAETQMLELTNRVEVTHKTIGGAKVKVIREIPAVKVEVDQKTPRAERPNTTPHKARLAVMPARFSRHFKPIFKTSETLDIIGDAGFRLKTITSRENESRMEAPSFTLSLVDAFVNSRKFDVLERSRLTQVMDEIDFGSSEYGDPTQTVPLGKALNAQYVVLPEIIAMEWREERKEIPYVDRSQRLLRGKMIVGMRATGVATSKILSSCTEDVRVQRRIRSSEPFKATEMDNMVLDLYSAAAQRLVHRTLEAIYPVRVLDRKGNSLVLNRGQGAIKENDTFNVYALGRDYVDPDTKEYLGSAEALIGKIRVTRVMPKISMAEIVAGSEGLKDLPENYLCRETDESINAKTTVTTAPINW